MQRETMTFDVVIVGGGPSGLATAIRLRQKALAQHQDLSVCLIEKGSELGAHIVSGAVIEPKSLEELFPDWRERGAPLHTPVQEDHFYFLTESRAFDLPKGGFLNNHGNFIVSLGNLVRWLGQQAEELGVEIYPGFSASEILYNDDGAVIGVATGDMGIGKEGVPTHHYTQGIELLAKQTVFAEGCRGSLTKELFKKFYLRKECQPQMYGLGIKELWEIDPAKHQLGKVTHSLGWPLDRQTYGGSFIYHLENNQISIGLVVGLDYKNPYLSPFEEFQRLKTHPTIAPMLEGGRRISYGARAISEGGFQAIPQLIFPGGLLVGDAAGFVNLPKIKGTHTAMKSGIEAADALYDFMKAPEKSAIVKAYPEKLKKSWLWSELYKVRNIHPAFHFGLIIGMFYAALENYIFKGRAPWTLPNHHDHLSLNFAKNSKPILYPKPDGKITFDRLSSVFLSNTNHEENQPSHLKLLNPRKAIDINFSLYDSPEQRYCPAGVYEIIESEGPKLQINAQNCVHCKTCDIKDPTQNITWVVPEGGGGPNYPNM
jgi:electron-transferring-flavoprotein dehydrogenase